MSKRNKTSRHLFEVQPQQRSSAGWQQLPPDQAHRADRWAVVAIKQLTVGGKPTSIRRVVTAHKSRAEAQAVADSMNGAKRQRGDKLPPLGQRFPSTGRSIIASSLSEEQYQRSRNS